MWQDWCRCNVCALTAGSLSQWLQVLYELSFWRAVKALQMNKRVESAENDKDWLFQLMTCRKQRSEMAGNSLRNHVDCCAGCLFVVIADRTPLPTSPFHPCLYCMHFLPRLQLHNIKRTGAIPVPESTADLKPPPTASTYFPVVYKDS